MDVLDLDAVGQADAVRRGDVSPQELARAAMERMAAVDDALRAVVAFTEDAAEEHAAAAHRAEGPLAGVPIVLKDLAIRQRGVPVGLGVRALEALRLLSPDDSATGRRLRDAGCVTVGVASTSPFGFGPWASTAKGGTRTPYDPARASSGSSGGSAALVAARAVAIGTSADAAGSTRLPAAWCGLVGHKPTRGLVPTDLVEPLVAEGVVTRTVRDTAAALDALAGAVPGDLLTAPVPGRSFTAALGAPAPRVRVGVLLDAAEAIEAPVRAAVEATARALEHHGHDVDASGPAGLDEQPPDAEIAEVVFALLTDSIDEAGRLAGRPLADGDLEPYIALMAARGRPVTAVARLRRDRWLQAWARRLLAWWQDHDVLVLPTCPFLPRPAELWEPVAGDPAAVFAQWWPSLACTAPFNRSGQPAITVPVAVHDGLPVGVQLVAAPGRDALLLQLAAALEAHFGWDRRRPRLPG